MTKLEELTRLIIEAIHGLPYEEAVKKEDNYYDENNGEFVQHFPFPITLPRVMAALDKLNKWCVFGDESIHIESTNWGVKVCDWKLLKESGDECTLEDQSEETKKALLTLFKG